MTDPKEEIKKNNPGVQFIDTQKDKYLTFPVGCEEFAIEIKYVTEIIGMSEITEVPDMPPYLKGVINLRGKVIPVLNVRARFMIDEIDYDPRTCIIIVKVDNINVGLIVDEVAEVLTIPSENVDAPPVTKKGNQGKFIKGLGKVENRVKMILNVERLLVDQPDSGASA